MSCIRSSALSGTGDRVQRTLLVTALSAFLGLVAVDAAHAAPKWLPPQNRQPGTTTGSFSTIGAWSGSDGSTSRVFASYRPRGGPYRTTVPISTPGVSASFNDGVAIDNTGRAFVAWTEAGIVKMAVSSTSGTFGAADTLSLAGASSPDVAVRPDGTAVIVWTRNGVIEFITRSPGGTYSPPAGAQPLSDPGGGAFNFHVAIGRSGDIAVVWTRGSAIEARYRVAGATSFGPVETPGPAASGVSLSNPKVAVDPTGRATAVWSRADFNAGGTRSINTAARTRTIGFGSSNSPVNPPATDSSSSSPDIGVDDNGFVTAVWYRSVSGSSRIEAATKPQGSSFGTTQPVSETSGFADFPELKVNSDGDVLVIWNRFLTVIGTRIVEAKLKPAGTSFDQNPVLGASSEANYSDFPDTALDADGNGIAFFGTAPKNFSTPTKVASAGLDSVGPRINSMSAPNGQAGRAIRFSVSTFDQWSTVNVSWNFGDGSAGANGASVSHTFGAGTYNVIATARDSVNNSASQSSAASAAAPAADSAVLHGHQQLAPVREVHAGLHAGGQ